MRGLKRAFALIVVVSMALGLSSCFFARSSLVAFLGIKDMYEHEYEQGETTPFDGVESLSATESETEDARETIELPTVVPTEPDTGIETEDTTEDTAEAPETSDTEVSGTEEGHVHSFTVKNTDEKYLYTEADCRFPASYLYSCVCGAHNGDRFYVGEPAEHVYEHKWEIEEYLRTRSDSCKERSTYYYACLCGAKGDEYYEGSQMGAHTFDRRIASDEYLIANATATSPAVYCYTCSCGTRGSNSFQAVGDEGWSARSGKVYSRTDSRFYSEPYSNERVSVNVGVGAEMTLVSTNGAWSKVNVGGRLVYLLSEHLSANKDIFEFTRITNAGACVLFPATEESFVLYRDMVDEAFTILYKDQTNYATVSVKAKNKTGDWIIVSYYGVDSNGQMHQFEGEYYMKLTSEMGIWGID